MGRMLNTRGLPETQKIELVLPIETQKTGWYALSDRPSHLDGLYTGFHCCHPLTLFQETQHLPVDDRRPRHPEIVPCQSTRKED